MREVDNGKAAGTVPDDSLRTRIRAYVASLADVEKDRLAKCPRRAYGWKRSPKPPAKELNTINLTVSFCHRLPLSRNAGFFEFEDIHPLEMST